MSNKTRIKRPTTATPRKVGTRRYLHVSTCYGPSLFTGQGFVKLAHGTTYRVPPIPDELAKEEQP